MKAMVLQQPKPAEENPLQLIDLPIPQPNPTEIRIKVHTCGVCHTDLHIVEGELPLPKLPIIPGHQVVGTVEAVGQKATRFTPGNRVGVPWLYSTCRTCFYCKHGKENLCDFAQFTGLHHDGGYAEYMVVSEDFVYPIPERFSDVAAAPLLCAGVIGYRALRLSEISSGGRLGIFGFGSSAHITLQVAKYRGCEIYVFTRSKLNQKLAAELGATWVGQSQDTPPQLIDSAIIFAPVGALVLDALRVLQKGGTIALAGIYMTPIPEIEYPLLYSERTIRSVANSTRNDVAEFLQLASAIPIQMKTTVFPFEQANLALQQMKHSQQSGAIVLQIGK
jgi:propanol-preferring alcohol dehydrogenase